MVAIYHSGYIPYIDQYLMASCLQMFFLLSGLVHKESGDIPKDLGNRSRSILLPYFLFNLFLYVARLAMDLHAAKPLWPDLGSIPLGVLYSRYFFFPVGTEPNTPLLQNYNGPMWFLTALMTSSLIFYPLHRWIRRQSSRFYLAAALLTCLGIAGAQLPILLPWSLDTAPFGALFMLLGAKLNWVGHFQQHLTAPRLGILAVALIAYLAICWYNPDVHLYGREYGNHGVVSAFAMFGIGALGSILYIWSSKALEGSRAGTAMAFFGRHTIFILCLHLFVYYWIDLIVVTHLGVVFPTRSLWLLYAFLKVGLSLVICAGLSVLFHKVKARVASRRLQHGS